MTTFLEPRDYREYLTPAERPPVHLLRILPANEMKATRVETNADYESASEPLRQPMTKPVWITSQEPANEMFAA
jgi:putative SOS response-associated peptidase YedK